MRYCETLSLSSRREAQSLKQEPLLLRKEVKVLVFEGCTAIKQIRLCEGMGFTDEERKIYRQIIYQNVFESIREIIIAMKDFEILHSNQPLVDKISECLDNDTGNCVLCFEIAEDIHQFLQDSNVENMINKQLCLVEDATYFLPEILRIGSPDYVPTDKDILRARQKHKGIAETRLPFGLTKEQTLVLLDVQGQQGEPRKWMHCFEDIACILFCASLSDYDRMSEQDRERTRMDDSLAFFQQIATLSWARRISLFLLLNESGEFRRKLLVTPLSHYFPEYTGGDDFRLAIDYFKRLFARSGQIQGRAKEREIYIQ
ncbi:Guanine nucleotide-binding protein alpha-2 subunit [Stygiomarasmius scandens]|uniref:Guanine nucleotide-binding protein alpha-2 subunit n=1 Tax=Marasmiellus scandens TaxID=2682957 RepID=A0ABR1J9N1_9AGAR